MRPLITQLATALAAVLLVAGVATLAGCGGGNQALSTPEGKAAHSGRVLFLADCGACHGLAAAGTTGTAGPDLDQSHPSYDRVLERVTHGGGSMPAFRSSLTRSQIEAIARYVASRTR